MLATNGGGFFNANASHPFENPTALSNYVQIISIFALGASLTNVFGRMVGNQRQGWAVLAVMGVLFIAGVFFCYWAEAHGNDALKALGLTGGNMEGKEVRKHRDRAVSFRRRYSLERESRCSGSDRGRSSSFA
jgi:K+-transporting ATPase ATPase A chain